MDRVIPLVKRIQNVWQGDSLRPNLNVTRRLVCISYIENESRNTSRKFTQNALPWLDLPGFEVFILVRGSRQNQNQLITHNYFDTFLMCSGLDAVPTVKLLNTCAPDHAFGTWQLQASHRLIACLPISATRLSIVSSVIFFFFFIRLWYQSGI